jgi:hypothetical protein
MLQMLKPVIPAAPTRENKKPPTIAPDVEAPG